MTIQAIVFTLLTALWMSQKQSNLETRLAEWQSATHHQHQFCLHKSESNLWWQLHTEVLFCVFHDDMKQEIKDLAITSCFQKDNLTRSFAQPLAIQSCAMQTLSPFHHENRKTACDQILLALQKLSVPSNITIPTAWRKKKTDYLLWSATEQKRKHSIIR